MRKPADVFSRARSSAGRDTADSLEIDRIVRLPLVLEPTKEEVEAFCKDEVEASYFEGGFRLWPMQVGAVLAYDLYGGLFAPIGVGWGKTLITLMIAERAFKRGEAARTLLFVPSQVYPQLVKTDIASARKWVGLSVPLILMGGKSQAERRSIARSQKKGCYVLPYSCLSTKDTTDLLFGIAPDLVILDEAHAVKNSEAARTKRLRKYMDERQPRLAVLSGTITKKSVNDYHYLISHALREFSPLPVSSVLASNWSVVLDAGADPSEAQTGPLAPLMNWATENFPDEKIPAGQAGFRSAYRLRLNTAPGVVSTGDAEIGVSLIFENRPANVKHDADGSYGRLMELISNVEDLWITPSGDEIEWAFHTWKYLFELTNGFYYRLRWPEAAELVQRSKLSLDEIEAYLAQAKMHHEAQQEYHRDLRKWLKYSSRAHLDTPLLVASNMAKHGSKDVGAALFAVWRAMKDLEFPGMPERISEPVRICDYKIGRLLEWAREHANDGAIVWFYHDEVGRWAHEALSGAGFDSLWCPSESFRPGSNAAVCDPANRGRILVASMSSHGTGKNLQHFQAQYLLQFPRQADMLEQVVGRTHRNGQDADELIVHTCNTIPFDHMNMAACLVDALYIHQTVGSRQKAIYASYSPLPTMYPSDFLRERGFVDVAQLDPAALAKLEEKFGPLSSYR